MADHERSEVGTPGEVARFLHQSPASLAQDRYRGTPVLYQPASPPLPE